MQNFSDDTTAVPQSYMHTVEVYGREFQRFSTDNRIHMVPVDDEEADRLQLQHQVLAELFDQRLIFPPIPDPQRVLDCGYGSGSWAVDVAENYPDCHVIGVDISSHMRPDDTPDNLDLQLDNLNREFTFSRNHFDLVHSRLVANGINRNRWNSYMRDIVRVLKPGGWVQMVEIYHNVQSDNGSITDSHALRRWSSTLRRSLEDIKDLRAPLRLNSIMSSAGLVDVDMRVMSLPLSAWSRSPRDRRIGEINKDNVHALLSSLALYPFTQRMHMSHENFQRLIDAARREVDDLSLKAYFPVYVCIGRKPGG